MKKYLAVAAMVGIISFLSVSMVNARGNYGHGPGRGYGVCDGYGYCNNRSFTEQDQEKVAVFLTETKETRKQIAVKRSERRALMSQDNPDEKKVAKLTGEIFDLKSLLHEKSKEVFGDNRPFPLGYGRGEGRHGNWGRGPCNM
jgi:Spy/CpxP family protein refolding chaperone